MVAVEVDGVRYPSAPTPQDNPGLPIFKTAELTIDQVDNILEHMWEGHLDYTNALVFSDYDTSVRPAAVPAPDSPDEPEEILPADAESPLRVWTLENEKSVEAEYVNMIGGNVVLKTTLTQ